MNLEFWISGSPYLLEAGDDGGELDEPLVDLLSPLPLCDDVVLRVRRRHGSHAGSPRWRRPVPQIRQAAKAVAARMREGGGAEGPARRAAAAAGAPADVWCVDARDQLLDHLGCVRRLAERLERGEGSLAEVKVGGG